MSFISICIPFYKNLKFLDRLLNSIDQQTFRDFEVVLSDDGDDETVLEVIKLYENNFTIRYYKNSPSLGTPANWNFAISKATGTWIKIMHNDDWFACNDSLEIFYQHIQNNPTVKFFFCAFQNVDEGSGKLDKVRLSLADKLTLKSNTYHLLKKVYIGNPSCTIIHKEVEEKYDKRYKFIVGFEFYIRVIRQTGDPYYIDQVLVSVGFHNEQVTSYTKFNPSVQLPENLVFLQEQDKDILKNILVFDYFWRLMRNLQINSKEKLLSYLDETIVPDRRIFSIIKWQQKIPKALLRNGLFSKCVMLLNYCLN